MNADRPQQGPEHRSSHPSDEELLARAIPIDTDSEEASEQPKQNSDVAASSSGLPQIDMDEADTPPDENQRSRIHALSTAAAHDAKPWRRAPNATGQGATHVKTFVAKLRYEAIEHLDNQINDWLDKHPECEVKFVTTAIGKLTGKITEEALFVNVWV